MMACVTADIALDAYAPELNDGTVDVSEAVLKILKAAIPTGVSVVEHTPERLLVTFTLLDGDFKEIHP